MWIARLKRTVSRNLLLQVFFLFSPKPLISLVRPFRFFPPAKAFTPQGAPQVSQWQRWKIYRRRCWYRRQIYRRCHWNKNKSWERCDHRCHYTDGSPLVAIANIFKFLKKIEMAQRESWTQGKKLLQKYVCLQERYAPVLCKLLLAVRTCSDVLL